MQLFLPPHRSPRPHEGRDCSKTIGAANAFRRRCRSGVTSLHRPDENDAAPHAPTPPHPASSSRRAARPEGLPRRLDPHLAFPPPPTHARSGAVPARSPLLPPRVPHRRPRRQRAGAELWVERRGEETEAESAASPPCHSEAGEPPPHAPPRPAQGCRARRGFISRLAQPTPQPREGAQPLGLHSPLRVPPSRAHTDPPFPSCLAHCSPLSPSHSWGPRAALPVPEPHALGMRIPLPTATQHCGASRNPQPRGSHCPLSAQESSWCPRRAAGGGMQGEEQHRNHRIPIFCTSPLLPPQVSGCDSTMVPGYHMGQEDELNPGTCP